MKPCGSSRYRTDRGARHLSTIRPPACAAFALIELLVVMAIRHFRARTPWSLPWNRAFDVGYAYRRSNSFPAGIQ